MIRKLELWVLIFSMLLVFSNIASALPTPHGISGYIVELDGINQVEAGTHFSVQDLDTGHYIVGVTGRALNAGKYSVSINGEDGDTIVLRAWTDYNTANTTVILTGVMRNVNLMLNTSLPPLPPEITSDPITMATENYLYNYHVGASDPNDDLLLYSLSQKPDGMEIDEENGLISWIPTTAHVGDNNITVVVSDGEFEVYHSFIILVNKSSEPIPQIQTPTPVYSSGGGGGGGRRIEPQNKSRKVVIILDTDKSPISQVVLNLKNTTENIGLNVTELPYRPQGTKTMLKKVYQYLRIDKNNFGDENVEEAIIEFIVQKSWLDKQDAKEDDVVLNRYTHLGWDELYTENISKNNDFVYYLSNTTGFSFFAISLKYTTPLVENITSNTILTPFRLFGIAYKTETKQMPAGTPFIIMNTQTDETVEGVTGIGPNSGAYSVVIHGNEGDVVTIKMGDQDYNASFSTVLREDLTTIDFLLNKEMGGFVPMTKENILLSRISDVRLIVFINSSIIFLILLISAYMIIKRIKSHKK